MIEFIRHSGFSPEYEEFVRVITNPNGRGNAAYKPELLPQDRLISQMVRVYGNCGIDCEFKWASGRQDGWVSLDLPDDVCSQDMKGKHQELIRRLQETSDHARKPH